MMKDKLTIPEHLPDMKEEDKKAAERRREDYALARDLPARENYEAIMRRTEKEKDDNWS